MIKSFRGKPAADVFERHRVRTLGPDVQRAAYRKLLMIHAATRLDSLRVPPGNRLEILKGDRAGQHSIRINDQWRICFVWMEGHAYQVEIVDYH
ncbi:MAG: type II toxin-antitoxin system RelE/ParE family toxin [Alphaproteobacteria bacterium]|nr:type II toxin-antitoxin system RelE/ParE family toxin [Alphaproteobacteria bacterium]